MKAVRTYTLGDGTLCMNQNSLVCFCMSGNTVLFSDFFFLQYFAFSTVYILRDSPCLPFPFFVLFLSYFSFPTFFLPFRYFFMFSFFIPAYLILHCVYLIFLMSSVFLFLYIFYVFFFLISFTRVNQCFTHLPFLSNLRHSSPISVSYVSFPFNLFLIYLFLLSLFLFFVIHLFFISIYALFSIRLAHLSLIFSLTPHFVILDHLITLWIFSVCTFQCCISFSPLLLAFLQLFYLYFSFLYIYIYIFGSSLVFLSRDRSSSWSFPLSHPGRSLWVTCHKLLVCEPQF